jgi:hypothetical protein
VPIPEAVRIAREMLEGLAAAHECGLIHRDIKPGNVWLEGTRQRVKILDFGLARPMSENGGTTENLAPLTESGFVVGTPAYMSPEQTLGEPLDGRSDLFSVGTVLYLMLTGEEPFRAPNMTKLLCEIVTTIPPRPASLNAEVPPAVDAFVMRLLAKKPDDRPATASEAAKQLRMIEADLAIANVGTVPLNPVPAGTPANGSPNAWAETDSPNATHKLSGENAARKLSAAEPAAQTAVLGSPRKPKWWLLVGSLLALPLVAAVAAEIIIKIKNKDGTETEIKVPDGSTVTVTKNGKELAKVGPDAKQEPPKALNDRQAAEFALRLGGKVWVNEAPTPSKIIGDVAALPKTPFTLTGIDLHGTAVADADLLSFKNCQNLLMLGLTKTRVGDKGLAHFKGVTKLTRLHLSGTQATDEGLSNFKDCKSLNDLFVARTKVTDAGLELFKNHRGICYIELDGTQITSAGLAHLKQCKGISWLNVSDTKVDDAGLEPFQDLEHLSQLRLRGTQVTDKALGYFRGKSLKLLDVSKTEVTEERLKEFAEEMPQCRITFDGGTFEPKK